MKKLEVRLTASPGHERVVGCLAESGHRVYFEYDSAFLRNPLWLSPFKLPPEPGLHEHKDLTFGPLFGLFDDSLPDGWGLLLMDRHFRRLGVAVGTTSPLDRLAYLGSRTMGALTYHPPASNENSDHEALSLHLMAREARQVLAGDCAVVLPQLLRAGGSPGGARPKVLVGVHGDELISGEDDLPERFTPWLVKFTATPNPPEEGRVEYAYAQMAKAAGVQMPPTRLFQTAEGDAFFGVERFDRRTTQRIHVHTFGNLIHANFRIPSCDYEQLLKVTRILTKNHQDVLAMFRRMTFNVLSHNRDDHVKNFAFLLEPERGWALAPAYDLTFSSGPGGEHSMTIAGEGHAPSRRHLLTLAESSGVSMAETTKIIDEVAAAVREWPRYAREAALSRPLTKNINTALGACLKLIA